MRSTGVYIFALLAIGTVIEIRGNPGLKTSGTIENRIVGGQIAKLNEIPYQVLLELEKMGESGFTSTIICGGSLISDRYVLTAAHCIKMSLRGKVYLGIVNRKEGKNAGVVVNVHWTSFIAHERFHNPPYTNDIGLIYLPQKVEMSDAIQSISLPKVDQVDLDNRVALISGFGQNGDYKSSDDLRYVQRNILPNQRCYWTHGGRFNSTIHICVDGSDKKSACAGDSGGPLVIEEADGSRKIVGVTSFGSGSCEYGSPVVYTRISAYLDWIHNNSGLPVYN